MNDIGLGNQLYRVAQSAMEALFLQGELAQLSYSAFDSIATTVRDGPAEVELSYPIGYQATKQPLLTTVKYKKEDLLERFVWLADTQLAINGLYQLVTVMEAMMADVLRTVILRYPDKLSRKRSVGIGMVLRATSIEEIHLHAVDLLLNDLSYKSPKDFAEAFHDLVSINLFECPAYHRYLEAKASRDICIHNGRIVNQVYLDKAATHARVGLGDPLPIDTVYFMESYENCLQCVEWIKKELHRMWHSSEFEQANAQQAIAPPE